MTTDSLFYQIFQTIPAIFFQLVGVAMIRLLITPEESALSEARTLIERVYHEEVVGVSTQNLLELVETLIVYKFSTLTREKIEAMFTLDELRSTRYF
ncbi:Rpn family recombination-promoting nuclease/putative transposase [Candidatus Synechococcus calcipolaris G9]|uniref:Rpn family recombination-promoting nuclease/putative transposase n=1 Tax=Candidatus Synechococcus calcipolaris G9 TaxID=1497997 RepID=A0ABT6F1J0_9SYNE|nr:DUF2887 domain-containing protein [Candidatus Synechococcus calcipolaris]MDG2991731.1 Rpn family recombination-promoting nuclease/putative transposase [Candidatus Synechococcus calcipolaris G9]